MSLLDVSRIDKPMDDSYDEDLNTAVEHSSGGRQE